MFEKLPRIDDSIGSFLRFEEKTLSYFKQNTVKKSRSLVSKMSRLDDMSRVISRATSRDVAICATDVNFTTIVPIQNSYTDAISIRFV